MEKRIRIGADELILWLRKNDKAKKIPNDEIKGLGRKIYDLIVTKLGGEKVADSQPSIFACETGDKNIEKFNLPKTSAQYEIEVGKMGDVYDELSNW
ncbi:MAG: hypothetical protein LBB15_00100 [Puniceicoccales bacterium]|jgi:hypothetical protein|nr:hypothetical protein [Puniceicoccales bacterium]